MSRITAWLRQHRHPRAFRIAEHRWDCAGLAAAIDELAAAAAVVGTGSGAAEPAVDDRTLAELANTLWRARHKLVGDGGSVARQARTLLRNGEEALAAAGVEVQDHDRAPYRPGLDLDVRLFQPQEGLTGEVVLSTIRPSIYVAGRRIQIGQVIVGTPVDAGQEDHHA
ncbi:hypothetical protein WEH80_02645 [Actinomycetes bacterium KLBMP 9759]